MANTGVYLTNAACRQSSWLSNRMDYSSLIFFVVALAGDTSTLAYLNCKAKYS